jgi:hypothetical protein
LFGLEVRRFALLGVVVLGALAVTAACGSFSRDDDAPSAPDGGWTDATGSDSAPADPNRPLEVPDAAGLRECPALDTAVDPSWMLVDLGDAGVSHKTVDAGNEVLAVKIGGPSLQRGYYVRVLDGTPCLGGWRYTIQFRMQTNPAMVDHTFAGPRVAGVHADLDAGADGFQNLFAVGLQFSKDTVELHLDDDACKQLFPPCQPLPTKDGKPAKPGEPYAPVLLFDKIGPGWHTYAITIVAFNEPTQVKSYGRIEVSLDGMAAPSQILPFPMRDTSLQVQYGVSYSAAGANSEVWLDDERIQLAPSND